MCVVVVAVLLFLFAAVFLSSTKTQNKHAPKKNNGGNMNHREWTSKGGSNLFVCLFICVVCVLVVCVFPCVVLFLVLLFFMCLCSLCF